MTYCPANHEIWEDQDTPGRWWAECRCGWAGWAHDKDRIFEMANSHHQVRPVPGDG